MITYSYCISNILINYLSCLSISYLLSIQSPTISLFYRYNAMKQKLSIMQTRLHEINNLVKTKNPSLLLQLQKGGSGAPAQSPSHGGSHLLSSTNGSRR